MQYEREYAVDGGEESYVDCMKESDWNVDEEEVKDHEDKVDSMGVDADGGSVCIQEAPVEDGDDKRGVKSDCVKHPSDDVEPFELLG